MGGSESKGQKLFVSVLQHMLAERGLKVKESTAAEFFQFLIKVSPWFPVDGELKLEDWKRVGREMKKYTTEHGENAIPKQAYPIWLQMREILTDQSDLALLTAETTSVSDQPLINRRNKDYGTKEPLCKALGDEDDFLSPSDEEELEEEAAGYHNYDDLALFAKSHKKGKKVTPRRKYLPPVGFAGAMAQAREEGDATFTFPVVFMGESDDEEEPVWEPLPLKTLKELQQAVKSMGPSAPYTIQVVEMVASQWLTPNDWHQTAKATLAPGDYIVWRTEYEDRSKDTVQRYANKRGRKLTLEMMLGTGSFLTPASQIKLPKNVLKEITTNAVLAWRAIPPPGAKKTVLAGIKQGNEESYTEFVSRLEEALNRMMPQGEGTEILLKQLAWENANALCQDLIRPIRRNGTVQDYIKACADASPAVVQGMAYAAAMKGQKYTSYVKQTYGGGKNRNNSGLSCFSCGGTGHLKKDCPQGKKEGGNKRPPPGVCPRCRKGKHWRNECKSKFDKEGNRIEEPETEQKN